jgi:hypothetical protein
MEKTAWEAGMWAARRYIVMAHTDKTYKTLSPK